MATIACQGCDILIDGTNVTNGSYLPTGRFFKQYTMYGNGNGIFSGITNFPMCDIYMHYTRADDGLCRQQTGRVTNPGNNPNSGWTANLLTGCTGTNGCVSKLIFYVNPNPILNNLFPNSRLAVLFTNYFSYYQTGGSLTSSGVPSGLNGYSFAMDAVSQDCGSQTWYSVDARWTAPIGASGFIIGASGHGTECTYCSPYEMVSL